MGTSAGPVERSKLRGAGLGLVALACALLTGGCCATGACGEDALPRTQRLETVYDAVDFVRYAVRSGCWDALYDALSTSTRERGGPDGEPLSRFDFGFAFPRATYGDVNLKAPPELEAVKLGEIVHASQIINVVEDYPQPGMAYVFLKYEPIPERRLSFPLIDEGTGSAHRWTLGLYEWAQEQTR
jgi:hypothetical protein